MFHTIIIVGNLGRDPEMRYTPGRQAVTNFSVATQPKTTPAQTGLWLTETIWFRISAWVNRLKPATSISRKAAASGRGTAGFPTTTPEGHVLTRQDGTSGLFFEVSAQTVRS